jgi:2,4-diketo-3-deoxy-L-fuconate hydrolase
MRICRYDEGAGRGPQIGFHLDDRIVPFDSVARASGAGDGPFPADSVLPFLRHGELAAVAAKAWAWLAEHPDLPALERASVVELLPIPRPPKLILLAGNYAAHIEEGGGKASERSETFPYLFMKPPSTCLTPSGAPVVIPRTSPDHIDWELELGVVIGKGGRHIPEGEALAHVAGYTVVNDISDRKFRPNPDRKERPKDSFFDWLHGKWHDSFCACGPCVASAESIPDPEVLAMRLEVNAEVKQDATTAQHIFPVAAIIAFVSGIVTLEPGDIISTGTPAGVGHASGTYLKPGDQMHATIEGIGTLLSPVVAEG